MTDSHRAHAHKQTTHNKPKKPKQAQCTSQAQLALALELLADMRRRGVEPNTHTYSSLLHVAAKAGDTARALDVYAEVRAFFSKAPPHPLAAAAFLGVRAARGAPPPAPHQHALL